MPRLASVDRSRLRLSEVARHVVIPEGIVDSLWFEVSARCEEFGESFDAWQDGLGQAALGVRADGMFAATIGGITLSIPRQVAKTFIVMRIVVALCTLFPDLTVIWTAHRMRTATNTFQKMKAFVLRPGVRGYLKAGANNGTAIRDANGEQEIPFANGSRIMFGAREQGFGRGFDEVDVEVFDEAQILTVKALEDMVAATNQSRFQHGALLFYMGTPPRPVDPGEVFTERRAEALAAKVDAGGEDFGAPVQHGDSLYVECSGDPDGDPDDPRQVERANPSYPHRTPPVAVKRLRKNLPDKDSWNREGLGIWDDTSAGSRLISAAAWRDAGVPSAPAVTGAKVFAVAFSADGSRVALGGAFVSDESVHVEVVDAVSRVTEQGVADLAEWLSKRVGFKSILLAGRSGAGVLEDELRKRGIRGSKVRTVSTGDYLASCAMFYDAIKAGAVTHLATVGQAALDDSVSVCDQKLRPGGAWGWYATTPDGDETPLEAVSLAHWGARTAKRRTGESVFR